MEFGTSLLDWANDTFVLNNKDSLHSSPEKWAAFSNSQVFDLALLFSIPPSPLAQASIERHGQVTSPTNLSLTELWRDSFHEDSVPAEQLQNKPLWLDDRSMQTLQNRQLQQPEVQQQSQQDLPERTSKRRRTSESAAAKQNSPSPLTSRQTDDPSPQPPKRKRGRPRSQPQVVEVYAADGSPFQMLSARQSYLEKNRVAAHKCRMRKREYITRLEGRTQECSNKNKLLKEKVALLREEVLELKNEVLRHAGCGLWAIEDYLARCAGDLLGIQKPAGVSESSRRSQMQSLAISTMSPSKPLRVPSADWQSNQMNTESQHQGDHGELDLLDGETKSPDVALFVTSKI